MIRSVINMVLKKLAGFIGIPSLQMVILNTQIQQRMLQFHYQSLLAQRLPLPKLSDAGFRVFSHADEDGILHYIFSLIGTTNKVCLEVAFTSPYGANTTNLIVNNGWNGILVCARESEVGSVERFFASHPDTHDYPPKVYQQWVTVENINETVEEGLNDLYLQTKDIDLFSLDIDGVDYWIWKALKVVEPRVVLVEYHNVLGERSITVPYNPDFNRFNIHPDYMGASLPAFVKLAKEKGYRLVGCNRYGYNAFFIRNGVGEDTISEVSIQDCLRHPQALDAQKNRLPAVMSYEWEEI